MVVIVAGLGNNAVAVPADDGDGGAGGGDDDPHQSDYCMRCFFLGYSAQLVEACEARKYFFG